MVKKLDSGHLKNLFTNTLNIEANALLAARDKVSQGCVDKLGDLFSYLRQTGGNLIFSGVGKSGLVGQKLASTFSSLGQPSFMLHPNEALHGDLGRVTSSDAIVWISNSGTTEEILKLMPFIDIPKELSIGLIGKVNSPIAENCAIVFDCHVDKEACLNNLAPTTSTTLAMAIGDAMAVVFESVIELSKESYAKNHPGGLLGKSLRLKVADIMTPAKECAQVQAETALREIIIQMTTFNTGGCAVVDSNKKLIGFILEGSFRRALANSEMSIDGIKASDVMVKDPLSVQDDFLAFKAFDLMENRKSQLNVVPVLGNNQEFKGILRLHDLFQAGFSS